MGNGDQLLPLHNVENNFIIYIMPLDYSDMDPSCPLIKMLEIRRRVQRSYNKGFGVDKNHQSLGAMVVSYCLGVCIVFMEGIAVLTLAMAHLFENFNF